MLERLRARGLHVCVWINPYIAQQSLLFEEAMENGYLLRRPNGDVWQWDRWQAGMGLVDFTNPDARRWYGDKLRALLNMGVDCFKTDFGERIPTDVVYFDRSDPHKMRNYYSYLYNKTVFDVLQEERGTGDAVVFARSATTGGQRFPVHWGGDCAATYPSMAESLRGGLSLGLSGFGFWSHDIGGFERTATPDLYKRWCAFGLLSSHSRLHGNETYRVPWLFDEEAVDVLRFFTNLKCRLMPYLFGAAREAHEVGVPIMRAMMLEFPDDPACDYLDRQYMLGNSLLVAPIFSQDGTVDYYLPPGRWTHFLTGKVIEGGRWLREEHDYMSLPLMARPNSVIPIGLNDRRPDYDYADGITLHIFELTVGATHRVLIPDTLGYAAIEATVRREATTIFVEVQTMRNRPPKPWSVLFRGLTGLLEVKGGSAKEHPLGMLIVPNELTSDLTIRLGE
jgi:alpha-D-xyloside xylohydrolase